MLSADAGTNDDRVLLHFSSAPLDKDSRAQDLGWKFRKEKDQLGVYFEFKPIVDTDPLVCQKRNEITWASLLLLDIDITTHS